MWNPFGNNDIESQQYHKGYCPFFHPDDEISAYAEAWRLLGTYIDCTDDGDDEREEVDDNNNQIPTCSRWWLFAAYIDENHSGNGFKEYQYLDTSTGEWIEVCDLADTSQRCKRMDCHEPGTHFTQIGVYKIKQEDGDFFDQLFKHEGYCVWDDDQYEFMRDAADMMPRGCTSTELMDSAGNEVYYDMMPLEFGKQTVGLYSDPSCIHSKSQTESDYLWSTFSEADDLYSQITVWEKAMDVFRVCQPCIAYNLPNVAEAYPSRSDSSLSRKLDQDEDDPFYCYDHAGYENVNQCYKFATKTDMKRATIADLQIAAAQRTILSVDYEGIAFGMKPTKVGLMPEKQIKYAWIVLDVAMAVFGLAFYYLLVMWCRARCIVKGRVVKRRVVKRPLYLRRNRLIRNMDPESLLDETKKSLDKHDERRWKEYDYASSITSVSSEGGQGAEPLGMDHHHDEKKEEALLKRDASSEVVLNKSMLPPMGEKKEEVLLKRDASSEVVLNKSMMPPMGEDRKHNEAEETTGEAKIGQPHTFNTTSSKFLGLFARWPASPKSEQSPAAPNALPRASPVKKRPLVIKATSFEQKEEVSRKADESEEVAHKLPLTSMGHGDRQKDDKEKVPDKAAAIKVAPGLTDDQSGEPAEQNRTNSTSLQLASTTPKGSRRFLKLFEKRPASPMRMRPRSPSPVTKSDDKKLALGNPSSTKQLERPQHTHSPAEPTLNSTIQDESRLRRYFSPRRNETTPHSPSPSRWQNAFRKSGGFWSTSKPQESSVPTKPKESPVGNVSISNSSYSSFSRSSNSSNSSSSRSSDSSYSSSSRSSNSLYNSGSRIIRAPTFPDREQRHSPSSPPRRTGSPIGSSTKVHLNNPVRRQGPTIIRSPAGTSSPPTTRRDRSATNASTQQQGPTKSPTTSPLSPRQLSPTRENSKPHPYSDKRKTPSSPTSKQRGTRMPTRSSTTAARSPSPAKNRGTNSPVKRQSSSPYVRGSFDHPQQRQRSPASSLKRQSSPPYVRGSLDHLQKQRSPAGSPSRRSPVKPPQRLRSVRREEEIRSRSPTRKTERIISAPIKYGSPGRQSTKTSSPTRRQHLLEDEEQRQIRNDLLRAERALLLSDFPDQRMRK